MVEALFTLSEAGKNGFNGEMSHHLNNKDQIIPQFNSIPFLLFLRDENLECKDYWKGIGGKLPLRRYPDPCLL